MYFDVLVESELIPGVIAAIQILGDRVNSRPPLHLQMIEDGVNEGDLFHKIPHNDDTRLAEIFGRFFRRTPFPR